jgi:type 1 glutamine amidotransferase
MRRLIAVLSVASVLLGASALPADARVKTKKYVITMEIHYGVDILQGTVGSSQDECFQDRKVEVFVDGKFVGRPTTDEVGYWEVATAAGSKYTAKVAEIVFKQTKRTKYVCRSAVVSVP